MKIEGILLFLIRAGYQRGGAWFGVVGNLAVEALLRVSFINCSIRRIFPTEGIFFPRHSKPGAIISKKTAINLIIADNTILTMIFTQILRI